MERELRVITSGEGRMLDVGTQEEERERDRMRNGNHGRSAAIIWYGACASGRP